MMYIWLAPEKRKLLQIVQICSEKLTLIDGQGDIQINENKDGN